MTALALSDAGALSVLGEAETGGAHPCHLAVTPDGRFLLCANYTGGSLAVFSLSASGAIEARTALVQHTGSGPDADRQEAAHVHMAVPSPDSTVVSAVDLGTDEIRSYTLSSDGSWSRWRSPRCRRAPARASWSGDRAPTSRTSSASWPARW